jgi:hypothetical protein
VNGARSVLGGILAVTLTASAHAQGTLPDAPVPRSPVPIPTVVRLPLPLPDLPTAPPLQVPSVPRPAPSTGTRPVPFGASAASGGGGAPSRPAVGTRDGAPSGGGQSLSVQSRAGGAASTGPLPSATGKSAGNERARWQREARRRDRRLRRAVLEQMGCLPRLSRLDRAVLVLRAGVARSRTRSRVRVADLLDLTVGRVFRVEREALRRLDRLAANGCRASAGQPSPGTDEAMRDSLVGSAAVGLPGRALLQAASGANTPSADAAPPSHSTRRRPAERNGVKGARAESPPAAGLDKVLVPKSRSLNLTIPLLVLIVVAGAVLGLRHWRWKRRMEAYRY